VNQISVPEITLLKIQIALTRNHDLLQRHDGLLRDYEIRQRKLEAAYQTIENLQVVIADHEKRHRYLESAIGLNKADIDRIYGHTDSHQQSIKQITTEVTSLDKTVTTLQKEVANIISRVNWLATPVWSAVATVIVGAILMMFNPPKSKAELVTMPDPPAHLLNHPACR
jgi:uncharacterized protein YoxC